MTHFFCQLVGSAFTWLLEPSRNPSRNLILSRLVPLLSGETMCRLPF